jgi:hypothetical protein
MCIPINSNCDNLKLKNVSMTLTFEVGTWFLDATHGLDAVCAILICRPSGAYKIVVYHLPHTIKI